MLTKLCRERVTLRYVSSCIFLQEVQELCHKLMGSFDSSKDNEDDVLKFDEFVKIVKTKEAFKRLVQLASQLALHKKWLDEQSGVRGMIWRFESEKVL